MAVATTAPRPMATTKPKARISAEIESRVFIEVVSFVRRDVPPRLGAPCGERMQRQLMLRRIKSTAPYGTLSNLW